MKGQPNQSESLQTCLRFLAYPPDQPFKDMPIPNLIESVRISTRKFGKITKIRNMKLMTQNDQPKEWQFSVPQ